MADLPFGGDTKGPPVSPSTRSRREQSECPAPPDTHPGLLATHLSIQANSSEKIKAHFSITKSPKVKSRLPMLGWE